MVPCCRMFSGVLAGNTVSRWALIEMVKIDLERRWQRGERVGLADYLRDYPELGTPQTVSADLVRAEYDVRRQFGERVDPVALLGPYEDRTAELARRRMRHAILRHPPNVDFHGLCPRNRHI